MLKRAVVVACTIAGLLQAWVMRHTLNPDGISYLDIADAYRERRWSEAINGYWSPLYSWLLAVGGAVSSDGETELIRVHVINLLIFLLTLWAFAGFSRQLERRLAEATSSHLAPSNDQLRCTWILFSFAVFAWATLDLIGVASGASDVRYRAASVARSPL